MVRSFSKQLFRAEKQLETTLKETIMQFDEYEKEILKAAANRYFSKDARINIRLSSADLQILKRKAAQEGLAYQSFIASILHKFASGSFGQS